MMRQIMDPTKRRAKPHQEQADLGADENGQRIAQFHPLKVGRKAGGQLINEPLHSKGIDFAVWVHTS
jgi:hypothetical protein